MSGQRIVSVFKARKIAQEQATQQLNTDIECLKKYELACKNGTVTSDTFTNTMNGASKEAQEYAANIKEGTGSAQVYADTQKRLQSSLKATSAESKIAAFGVKTLSLAFNMLSSMAISYGLQFLIGLFSDLANAQESAIEKANEVIGKFEEQRDALASNKETIENISSDYENLAKGVDSLGRNMSLNSEEYSKYNNIVNQIADMFPQMVQGYTDEGNAIIKHKGNVEELTKAYKEQKDAAQSAIIVGSADVFKGFKVKVDHDAGFAWEESGLLQMKNVGQELLQKLDSGELDYGDFRNQNSLVFQDFLQYAGVDLGTHWTDSGYEEELEEQRSKIVSAISKLTGDINAETAKIKPIMQAYLDQSLDFQGIDEKAKDVVKQIVGQFDSEFYAQFDNETEMATWVTENIVNKFKGKDGEKMAIEFGAMFDLQTKFNEGNITVDEYQEKLTAFLSLIGSLPDETQKAIKLLFGITTNEDGSTSSDVDTMIANVKEKFKGKFDKEIGQLKLDDLEILTDLDISPEGIESWSEVETLIANAGKEANKMTVSLESFNKEVDEIQDAYDTLSSAVEEYNTTGHMSLDTVQKLLSLEPQYLAMLVNENGQLSLNEQSMRDLLIARLEETKAKIFENGINQINALTVQKTGTASEEAAGKKADAVGDIQEETDALNDNTEAKLRNVAANAVEGGASQEEVDAIVNATIAQATALESAVNGLSFDFGGTVGGGASKNSSYKGKPEFDDSYYSSINAWLTENEKQIGKFAKERESLNRHFESALDSGNKDQAEILRSKLAENSKVQKDILHQQNEAHRTTQKDLLQSLYQYAPEITGKSWDEISEVDLLNIENNLSKTKENASSDDAKNKASYNLNQFKGIIEDLKAIDNTIAENSKTWLEIDDNQKADWESLVDFQDDFSNNWIDNQKALGKLSEEEELAAYARMIENNKEFQKQILADEELTQEAKAVLIKKTSDLIAGYEQDSYQLRQEHLNTLLSQMERHVENIKDEKQELIDALDDEIAKENAIISIRQKQFDFQNSLTDAEYEANKAIAASRASYDYLDEDTRKAIYNEDDYAEEIAKIKDIRNQIDKLADDFVENIDEAYDEGNLHLIESITAEFEQQCELKERELEILQAEVDLQKKQNELNNILAEKNVRILKDGKWQWTHDAEAAKQAEEALADAENQVKQLELQQEQQAILDKKQAHIRNLETEKAAYEKQIAMLDEETENLRKAIENIINPLTDVEDLIDDFANVGVRSLNNAVDDLIDVMENATNKSYTKASSSDGSSGSTRKYSSSGSISSSKEYVSTADKYKSIDYSLIIQDAVSKGDIDTALKANKKRNDKIDYLNMSEPKWSEDYIRQMAEKGYASGTKNATAGFAWLNEEGNEGLFTKNGAFIPMGNLGGGEMVFNHEMMENLWNQAQLPLNSILNNSPVLSGMPAAQVVEHTTYGDIHVHNPMDYNDFLGKLNTEIKMLHPITKNMTR